MDGPVYLIKIPCLLIFTHTSIFQWFYINNNFVVISWHESYYDKITSDYILKISDTAFFGIV